MDENATRKLDQHEYRKKYDGYASRYAAIESRMDSLEKERERKEIQYDLFSGFLAGLGETEELLVDFNEKLFHRLVDYTTVYPDGRGGAPSATAWRLAQRFERKQRAGSGDFRISCPLFLRVLFLYAPQISYYHSVSHVPDVNTDNRHGELVPACSLDKSIKSAIFKIVKKLTVR